MEKQFTLPGFESPITVAADPEQLHTLYFMIMLPEPVQQRTQRLCAELGESLGLRGPFIEASRMHLTLLALGGCYGEPPNSWLDALRNAARRTHAGTVPLSLNRVRSFSRAFVLVGGPNPALNRLRQALRRSLREVGWTQASNTQAHITLSYESRRHGERAIEPLAWTADSFCLIDSLYGRHQHRLLGEWRLHHASQP